MYSQNDLDEAVAAGAISADAADALREFVDDAAGLARASTKSISG